MKVTFPLLLVLAGLVISIGGCRSAAAPAEPGASDTVRTVYSRCNLKVLKGTTITWVNWQGAPEVIPVGAALEVWGGPENWQLRDPASGRTYNLQAGAAGEQYLDKFVISAAPRLTHMADVVDSIEKGIAVPGMTREEVYVSMGPPTKADNTSAQQMTYDEILARDLWVWRRKTFGKNIGVAFDPTSGRVTRTEGIWKK